MITASRYRRVMNRLRRAMRDLARWVLATVHPTPDEIDGAIRHAYRQAGVALEDYAPDHDLGSKFHEVLIHACRRLGYRTSTTQDVRELLE